MKIRIGNAVYDSATDPVQLIMSDEEKALIANMSPDNKRIAFFPEEWGILLSADQRLKWMLEEINPEQIYIYYDRDLHRLAVRSDIDGVTCLHYKDGAKHERDAFYLLSTCTLVMTEPKSNKFLMSSLILGQMVHIGTSTFVPTTYDVPNRLYVGFGTYYAPTQSPITAEDLDDYHEFREWLNLNREELAESFKCLVPNS